MAGGETDAPRVEQRQAHGVTTLALAGAWESSRVAAVDPAMRAAEAAALKSVATLVIDLKDISRLDTAGAWLVERTRAGVSAGGGAARLDNAQAPQRALLDVVAGHTRLAPARRGGGLARFVARVGEATIGLGAEARDLVNFLGAAMIMLGRLATRPWRLRATPLVFHLETVGLSAMPIVGLIAFLIGIVLAYQGSDQLARFGAEIFTVNLVAVGVLREMGVLLTAILLAGRTGSAFAAEIGTMNANEEIAAMQTMGLDPLEVLVQPRVLALVIALPLLTFFADIMGLAGGALTAVLVLDITLSQYIRQLHDAVTVTTFWVGMIKAPVFALVIALVGCFEGLAVTGSAESVGRHTTRAVVVAIFLVIVLDAGFSVLFSILGI